MVFDDLYDLEDPYGAVPVMSYEVTGEQFLVDGLIHEAATVLYGRPEAGKSFYALSLADAISKGASTWLGHKVLTAGAVLFMGLDPGQQKQTRLRVNKIPGGSEFLISTKRPQPTDEWWKAAARWCARHEIKLLIIDNLTRIMPPGASWRHEDQVATVLRRLDIVIDHGTAVVLMHHSGKPGEDGRPMTTPVGSTAIEAWARSLVRVERPDRKSRKAVLHVEGNDEEPFDIATLHKPDGVGDGGPFFDVLSESRAPSDEALAAVKITRGMELARHVLGAGIIFMSANAAAKWLVDVPPPGGGARQRNAWQQELKRYCFDTGLLAGGGGREPITPGPSYSEEPVPLAA